MTNAAQIATCVGCECTDLKPCRGGCSWLYVDYDIGYGVCSSCPEVYEDFLLRLAVDEDAEPEKRIEVVQDIEDFAR